MNILFLSWGLISMYKDKWKHMARQREKRDNITNLSWRSQSFLKSLIDVKNVAKFTSDKNLINLIKYKSWQTEVMKPTIIQLDV